MRIALVVASEAEMNALLPRIPWQSGKGVYWNVETILSGPGMVATAYCLGKTFAVSRPDFAINLGIAGSFRRDISIGAVVQVVKDCFPEFGAVDGEHFLPAYRIGLQENDGFPYEEGWLKNSHRLKSKSLGGLPELCGITVNTVHGDEGGINAVMSRLAPDIESMEGAAFMHACLLESIPFIQVRAISNYVEKRNRAAWDIPLALENLGNFLNAFLTEAEETGFRGFPKATSS